MANRNSQTPAWLAIVIGLLILGGLFLWGGSTLSGSPEGQARAQERAAIEFCEDNYDRLKEDPRTSHSAQEIAYGVCDQMKADFRRKWNREP